MLGDKLGLSDAEGDTLGDIEGLTLGLKLGDNDGLMLGLKLGLKD